MKAKNPAAVALGSLGGKASAKKLTPKQRNVRAKKAVAAKRSEEEEIDCG